MKTIREMKFPKLGLVNVSYAVGVPSFESVQGPLRRAIPAHIACQHLAYDDNNAYGSASIAIYMLSKRQRVRFRSHKGRSYIRQESGVPLSSPVLRSTSSLSQGVTSNASTLSQPLESLGMQCLLIQMGKPTRTFTLLGWSASA